MPDLSAQDQGQKTKKETPIANKESIPGEEGREDGQEAPQVFQRG